MTMLRIDKVRENRQQAYTLVNEAFKATNIDINGSSIPYYPEGISELARRMVDRWSEVIAAAETIGLCDKEERTIVDETYPQEAQKPC